MPLECIVSVFSLSLCLFFFFLKADSTSVLVVTGLSFFLYLVVGLVLVGCKCFIPLA